VEIADPGLPYKMDREEISGGKADAGEKKWGGLRNENDIVRRTASKEVKSLPSNKTNYKKKTNIVVLQQSKGRPVDLDAKKKKNTPQKKKKPKSAAGGKSVLNTNYMNNGEQKPEILCICPWERMKNPGKLRGQTLFRNTPPGLILGKKK